MPMPDLTDGEYEVLRRIVASGGLLCLEIGVDLSEMARKLVVDPAIPVSSDDRPNLMRKLFPKTGPYLRKASAPRGLGGTQMLRGD